MEKAYPMAFVTAPGRIELLERRLPDLQGGDVLVKVKAASICGSDLHIFKGRHPDAALPVALGHEAAGEVACVGGGVSKVKPGDRVVVEPVVACGRCFPCRSGDYNYCAELSRPFKKGRGYLSPYLVADQAWVHPLPAGLSFEEAALVEPLSVALHAVKRAGAKLGHTAAIFGAGPIGLMVLQMLRVAGVRQTFVVDIDDFRLGAAKKMGASYSINPAHGDAVDAIRAATDGLGVDRAFEAAGSEQTVVGCLKALKRGGLVVILGIVEGQEARVPIELLRSREIGMLGSRGYCWDFQEALALVEAGALSLAEMVTHTTEFRDLQHTFERLCAPGSRAIKVVVRM